jgi:nucleoside-diphosphate kinase
MRRGPAFVAVLEGPEDTFAMVRAMMGPTNSAEAPPGTIRGDFGTTLTENLVHGSDSEESAAREIGIFFPGLA